MLLARSSDGEGSNDRCWNADRSDVRNKDLQEDFPGQASESADLNFTPG